MGKRTGETGKQEDEKIAPMSDKQLDKLWIQHIRDYTNKGILLTFKPVRYYNSKERNRLDRLWHGLSIPPDYNDLNSKPLTE